MRTKRERITRLYLPGRPVGPPLSGGTKDSIRFFPTRDVSSPSLPPPFTILLRRAREPDRRDHRCVFLLNASRVRVVKGSHGWANLLPMGTHGDSGSSPNTPVATRPSYESSTTASSFSPSSSSSARDPFLVFFLPGVLPFFATRQDLTGILIDFMVLWKSLRPGEKSLRWHYITTTGILGVHYERI